MINPVKTHNKLQKDHIEELYAQIRELKKEIKVNQENAYKFKQLQNLMGIKNETQRTD